MTGLQTDTSSAQTLADEMYQLLLAHTPAESFEPFLASLRRRSMAGFFGISCPIRSPAGDGVQVHWAEDVSGGLDGYSITEVAKRAIDETPVWLLNWVLRRKFPFHLNRYARYIPFSASWVLENSAPEGKPKIKDFIIVPYHDGYTTLGGVIGSYQQIQYQAAREISLLTTTFLALKPWGAGNENETELNQRQLDCLKWLVAGKSIQKTAQLSHMSYSNVRYHLERAKEQVGLSSLHQLIAYAAVKYRLSPYGPEEASNHLIGSGSTGNIVES